MLCVGITEKTCGRPTDLNFFFLLFLSVDAGEGIKVDTLNAVNIHCKRCLADYEVYFDLDLELFK